MNLRDIVVVLDAGTASEERLSLATSIARQHEACLSAVFVQDERVAQFPSGLSVPRLGLMAGAPVPIATTEFSRSRDICRHCRTTLSRLPALL